MFLLDIAARRMGFAAEVWFVGVREPTIRIALVLPFLVGLSACRPDRDLEAEAVEAVVADLMTRAPGGNALYILPEWQIAHTGQTETIPPAIAATIQRVSGLPMADAELGRQVEGAAFLYMFRPRVATPDSVRVLAGWLRWTGGDGGGAWGDEFDYEVVCTRRCTAGSPSESVWN